ncbi:MAG: Unknown protein [uncultured Sulfurovum sp.]|uniref:Uncharacterized protein n=1 Tax=uncultured Sulfurovum sp. TaxID=269237 RepID=A0A6S6TK90_9BACT|nr:MAG: Unknown protein [uncultured Sulfurovum sp.]
MKYAYILIFIIISCTYGFSNDFNTTIDNNISTDKINTCLAIAQKNLKYCTLIKDHDNKSSCFGIVKKNTGYCSMIKDSDIKNECLAIALSDITNCNKIKNKISKDNCITLYGKINKDLYIPEECNH